MSNPNRSLSSRFYALLLWLYPPRFRRLFGAEMARVFERGRRRSRGAGVVAFWFRSLSDLLRTAPAEWWDALRSGLAPERRPSMSEPRLFFDALGQDVRYAARNLKRSPGFSLVAILSLTLGITTATLVFSFVKAFLFRPPAQVAEPERLAVLYLSSYRGERFGLTSRSSYGTYLEIRDQAKTVAALAAYCDMSLTLDAPAGGTLHRVPAAQVTGGYFGVLGTPLALGRDFADTDLEPGSERVAVISHGLWQRELGGDPGVLERTIRIEGRPHAVIGVAAPGARSLGSLTQTDVWIPVKPEWRGDNVESLILVGRLAPGVALEGLRAELDVIASRLTEKHPRRWTDTRGEPRYFTAVSEKEARSVDGAPVRMLTVLTVVITLILLIACSNVTSLLLTRAWRRRREIAVRLALGAGRARLGRQLLTESVVLTSLAGGLSFVLTWWMTRLVALGRVTLPLEGRALALDVGADAGVALFAAGLALATGVGFGLVPALQGSRPDVAPALQGAAAERRPRRFSAQNVLVTAKVAGALVLVVMAGLLVRSFQKASDLDLGFDAGRVALATLDLSHRDVAEDAGLRFHEHLADRLAALPDVEAVAQARNVPFVHASQCGLGAVEGASAADSDPVVACNTVSSGYFGVMGIPVVRGRVFDRSDRPGAPRAAVVNEAFAERFWPGGDPLGKRLGEAEVIGVVGNTRFRMLTEEHLPHVWYAFAQDYQPLATVHVRTAGDPRALLPVLREQIRAMDPELTVLGTDAMEDVTAIFTEPQRIASKALGWTGGIALVLAMMGIYGVVAHLASLRTREVGIRVALGAHPRAVVRMLVREGMGLTAVGIAAGIVAVPGVTRLLGAVLVGVDPLDAVALAGGVALLVASSVLASWVPAARAARVDPAAVLRDE